MVFVKFSIQNLLFSFWKPPVLTSDELTLEKQKEALKKSLSSIESRLEALEILISNDKLEETKLLFRYLAYDLINCQLQRTNQKEIPFEGNLQGFVVPETNKKLKPFSFLESLGKVSDWNEKEMENGLSTAIDTFEYLSSESKKEFKTQYLTQLDQFLFLRKVRIGLVSAILVSILFGFSYFQYKYPVFKDQSIKLYTFTSRENPNTSESLMVTKPVLKKDIGNWVMYEWELPKSMAEFGGLRIDPLEQRGIRFSLDQISILDSKGKEVYNKKIIVSSSFLPEDYQDYLKITDIKTASKQIPGELVEMITTGSDPQIHFVFPTVKDAKTIKLKMKFIEAHKVKKK
ncbi:hypothetical protein EHQ31_06010 [Leptospira montravelensis]|uniref:Uncharacterized protein n=1 Tax=Leptospira montravelensis TaxID=2484961 RepID=A0ABY2LZM8_9LEPT|nr:hypothetical protein [Leptospira montravelensis]TGK84237.1 hypothetical protein EHQ19_06975 [Leptospira montravelensis]TGL06247.1 hypothetical protein EHQ31_06010 [Leptospira montravelensis]